MKRTLYRSDRPLAAIALLLAGCSVQCTTGDEAAKVAKQIAPVLSAQAGAPVEVTCPELDPDKATQCQARAQSGQTFAVEVKKDAAGNWDPETSSSWAPMARLARRPARPAPTATASAAPNPASTLERVRSCIGATPGWCHPTGRPRPGEASARRLCRLRTSDDPRSFMAESHAPCGLQTTRVDDPRCGRPVGSIVYGFGGLPKGGAGPGPGPG